jgi:hypothetical protein
MRTKIIALFLSLVLLLQPSRAYADFWGGDLPLLAEIVANTLQQISQLSQMIGNGRDTLNYLHDINRGIADAMRIARTMNSTLHPGVLSDLQTAEDIMSRLQDLYGRIPRTSEARVQQTTDQSVAEAIQIHNQVYQYADQVDPEAERIKEYARDVSPVGAQKLSAQALGVLIHVMNQILRTNGAILKLQSEQLAITNKKEKLNSEQFKTQYDGISKAFGELKPSYHLPSLTGKK